MKKRIAVITAAVLLATAAAALSKNQEFIAKYLNSSANAQAIEPESPALTDLTTENNFISAATPDHIVFDMLFHMTKRLDEAAARLETQGRSGRIWREYFERHAGINMQQANLLRQVTNDFYRDVSPIHQQAMQIIIVRRNARAAGLPPTTTPPELSALQLQRQIIALRHRDRLSNLLGNEAFERLRQAMLRPPGGSNQPPFDMNELQLLREQTNQQTKTGKEEEGSE